MKFAILFILSFASANCVSFKATANEVRAIDLEEVLETLKLCLLFKFESVCIKI